MTAKITALAARACTAFILLACSSSSEREGGPYHSGSGGEGGDPFENVGGGSGASGIGGPSAGFSGASDDDSGAPTGGLGGEACATETAMTELLPVHLAFAFDVSGSMGKGDELWHDQTLKWDPVVAATSAFFEADSSSGLQASLTFFPADGDEDDRCVVDAYAEPDVEMQALPSTSFGEAIAAIEAEDWRGGTPTLFVVQGTLGFIETYRQEHEGRYVLVLVTDGYPQGCDEEDDSIEAVAAEVQAATDDGIDTYVVGVANPPIDGAPDTVSDLHAIAEAGNTEQAFLIDTGDPAATASAFSEAVDAIRGAAITCDVAIPAAPDGRTFDKERIAVTYGSGGDDTALTYDADCGIDDAFRYDDPADPSSIVLCESTCEAVTNDPSATLRVDFACEQVFMVD
jgi:hypothetical protein